MPAFPGQPGCEVRRSVGRRVGFGSWSYDLDLRGEGAGSVYLCPLAAVSPLILQEFHPATVCGAEEGAPRPAHTNPRMFGGAAQALGPLW